MFDRSTSIGMLRQGANGTQILEILDTLVDAIVEENINDCAAHYAAISSPTLEQIAF